MNVLGPAPFVLGSTGQLGRALRSQLGAGAVCVGRSHVDFSEPSRIRGRLDELWGDTDPLYVINAAAYTEVDKSETEPVLARAINTDAPREIALWCRDRCVPFVHYSTDYVYDGTGAEPHTESTRCAPVNRYGRSKLDGDEAVEEVGGAFLILRTSWVYDTEGKNFLRTILRLAAERDTLAVVSDQCGAPTYAPHLAQATLVALQHAGGRTAFPSGVYHLCAGGETTWHGFAVAALERAARWGVTVRARDVRAIATSDYPTAAKRPLNSRLQTSKAEHEFGVRMPQWQDGLSDCMQRICEGVSR
jgi:dTDP-4-dehydrorhamnose reductase